jgi:hypothetical protein
MKTALAVFVLTALLCGSVQAAGDLVICIDTSGSMRFKLLPDGQNIPGSCADMMTVTPDPGGAHPPETRYRIAHDALFDIVQNLLSPMAEEGPVGAVHVVRFPDYGTATPQTFSATCVDNPFTSSPTCDDLYDSFLTTDLSISCIYGTPLKSGLGSSNAKLYPPSGACPSTPGVGKMILLICDGQPTDGWNPVDVAGDLQNLVCDDVQINAVGIGNYAANDYFDLLFQIAKERNGKFFGYVEPIPPLPQGSWQGTAFSNTANILTLLEKEFMNILGYQPYYEPAGFLSPGDQADFEFTVTPLDTGLVFAVHWEPGNDQDIAASIVLPDKTEIQDSAENLSGHYRVSRSDGSVYFMFFKRLIESNYGEWQLKLHAADANPGPVEYTYSVYTTSPLVVSSDFPRAVFKTGDYLNGKTSAKLRDELVKNVSVEVSFVKPENWRGDWISTEELSEEELRIIGEGMPTEEGKIARWAEDTPLIDRKCVYLQAIKGKAFTELFDEDVVTETLYDDGKHNDGAAGDGILNNNFLEAVTPGMYQVLYRITGTTADGSPFRRELFFHSYVEVNVQGDWQKSKISFKRLPDREGKAATRVLVKPIGILGHVPLPGKGEMIEIAPEHGSVHGALVDRLDGTYAQEIVYDPGLGKPNVFVAYGLEKFPPRRVVYVPEWQGIAYAGVLFLDNDLQFTDPKIWGIKIDRYLTDKWFLEAVFGVGEPKDNLGVKGTSYIFALNAKLSPYRSDRFRPFVVAGVGRLGFSGFTFDDGAFAANIGTGLDFALSDHVALGLEATDYIAFDLYGESVTHNLCVGGGVIIRFY